MVKIFEILASLAESFIAVRFCCRFLTFKNGRLSAVKYLILFLFLSADNILLSQLPGFEELSAVLLIISLFVFALVFLKGSIYEKMLVSITPALTILPVNLIVLHTFSLLSGRNVSELANADGNIRIVILFFTKFLFFLLCEISVKIRRRGNYSLNGCQWSIQLSCFIVSFIMANSLWKISLSFAGVHSEFLFVYLMIALLNVLLYILLLVMEKDNISKEQYRIMELKLDAQKQQCLTMSEQYKEARILRHDIKHCLTAVSELILKERYAEADSYIESFLDKNIDTSAYAVNTDIPVIDAVINNRIVICKKRGIKIKCAIDTEIKRLDETDISILLSNLLDNAISGTAECAEPTIELSVQKKKSYILISVKNTIAASVLKNNPELETRKADKKSHGYGIMSIKKVAEKYNGSVEFYEKDMNFINEVWLEA